MLEIALFALRRVESDLVLVVQQCKLVALQAQQEGLRLRDCTRKLWTPAEFKG